jgi:hypothetical protein
MPGYENNPWSSGPSALDQILADLNASSGPMPPVQQPERMPAPQQVTPNLPASLPGIAIHPSSVGNIMHIPPASARQLASRSRYPERPLIDARRHEKKGHGKGIALTLLAVVVTAAGVATAEAVAKHSAAKHSLADQQKKAVVGAAGASKPAVKPSAAATAPNAAALSPSAPVSAKPKVFTPAGFCIPTEVNIVTMDTPMTWNVKIGSVTYALLKQAAVKPPTPQPPQILPAHMEGNAEVQACVDTKDIVLDVAKTTTNKVPTYTVAAESVRLSMNLLGTKPSITHPAAASDMAKILTASMPKNPTTKLPTKVFTAAEGGTVLAFLENQKHAVTPYQNRELAALVDSAKYKSVIDEIIETSIKTKIAKEANTQGFVGDTSFAVGVTGAWRGLSADVIVQNPLPVVQTNFIFYDRDPLRQESLNITAPPQNN